MNAASDKIIKMYLFLKGLFTFSASGNEKTAIASGYIVGGFVTMSIVLILFMLKKADDPQDFVKHKDDVI